MAPVRNTQPALIGEPPDGGPPPPTDGVRSAGAERPAYVYRHCVGFEETNLVGNVYYTSHLSWQGRCREMFLRDRAPAVLDALAGELRLVTLRCACEYFAELLPFDEIAIHMRLDGIEHNRIALGFDYRRDGSGGRELVARGNQEIASMRAVGGGYEPTPLPRPLIEALRPYGGSQ